jgi:thioesterase domain-containing protein
MFEAGAAGPTVQELARDYIEVIREQQPHGPYRLLGMSFGGVVAYEVAQQLRSQGEEVQFLALLDSALPERRRDKLERLVALPPLRIVEVVARRIARKILRKWRANAAPNAAFTRYDDKERQLPLDSRRQRAYRRAMRKYVSQVQPWEGEATLLVSGQRLARDPLLRPDCGWTPHVDRLDLHTVDADHLGLLEKPKVQEVAGLLLAALERAEAAAAPRAAASSR